MTAKDLKNALLQEAVQGKLVPQIASEGNARDLLDQIKKEKAKLVKEGKLKKEKPLPEITEDEIPFDIPENWCWCRLGEICNVRGGKRIPAGRKLTRENTGHKYIRVTDMKNGTVLDNDVQYITEDIYKLIKADTISKKDVYITVAGTIGQAGTIPDFFDNANLTENADKLELYKTDKDFIVLMLNSPYIQKQIKDFITKVGQPKLAIMRIQTLVIALPPLAEQKQIVATIEKFMPLIEEYGKKETERKAFNEQIGTLTKKAILQEAVQGKLVPQIATEGNAKDLLEEIKKEKAKLVKEGKIKRGKPLPKITEDEIPFDIPESWCWCRLGEIVNYKMGKTPPRAETEWWGNKEDTPWISIADMVADGHINKTKEFMSWKAIKEVFNNTVSKEGTLIMSFKLTVGRVSILDIDATHNEAIISIYPYIDSDYCTRNYLFNVLPLLSQNGETKDAIKGRTLNSTSLSNMLIPLPPLNEQKRIVAAIEKILPLCKKL